MQLRVAVVIVAITLVELMSAQQGSTVGDTLPRISWGGGEQLSSNFRAKREEASKGPSTNSSVSVTKRVGNVSSTLTTNGTSSKLNTTGSPSSTAKNDVIVKTLVIPDRTPANYTPPIKSDENQSGEEEDSSSAKRPGQGNFDEKAVQRTIIVIAGIAVIVMVYLGIKFALIKRRKVEKRYGRVEASEMDLLDEMEEEEESEEEEELFDINQRRRS